MFSAFSVLWMKNTSSHFHHIKCSMTFNMNSAINMNKTGSYTVALYEYSIVWTEFAFLSWGGIVFYATIIEFWIDSLNMASFVRFLQCRHYFLLSSVLLRQKCLSLSYEQLTNPWGFKRIKYKCFSHAVSFIIWESERHFNNC